MNNPKKIAVRTRARFLSPFVVAERGYIDEAILLHGARRLLSRAQFRRCLANRICDEREVRADSGEPATAAFSRARRAAEQAACGSPSIAASRGFRDSRGENRRFDLGARRSFRRPT
jgi:hypothetical protein